MTAARAHPCPDCGCEGEPCVRHTTTFTQGDSSTVDGFTEVSGDWEVSSNVLLTLDDGAIIVSDSEAEDGHGVVTCTGWANSSNESIWLIGSYVDSNNFVYLKFKFHNTTAQGTLWERSGGTDTQLSEVDVEFAMSPGTPVALTLCWDGSEVKASLTTSDNALGWQESYSGTGTKGGLGHSGTGSCNFTAFSLARHAVDDAECDECTALLCGGCGFDVGWQVFLPVDFSCFGNHIVDELKRRFIDPGDSSEHCYWVAPISGCGGSVEYIRVERHSASGSPAIVMTIVVVSDGVQIGGYVLDDTDGGWPGNSCSDFNNTEIAGSGAGEFNSIFLTAI